MILRIVDLLTVEDQDGTVSAVQVIGDLDIIHGRDELTPGFKLEGFAPALIRPGHDDAVFQVAGLGDGYPLGQLIRIHVRRSFILTDLSVIHQQRPEIESVDNLFSVDLRTDISGPGVFNSMKIT